MTSARSRLPANTRSSRQQHARVEVDGALRNGRLRRLDRIGQFARRGTANAAARSGAASCGTSRIHASSLAPPISVTRLEVAVNVVKLIVRLQVHDAAEAARLARYVRRT